MTDEIKVPKYLVNACEKYLADQHYVIYGHPYDISDPKQRREAAEWLAREIKAASSYLPAKPKPEKTLCFAPRNGNAQSKIECEQALNHKGPHAGRGAKDRWYTWE